MTRRLPVTIGLALLLGGVLLAAPLDWHRAEKVSQGVRLLTIDRKLPQGNGKTILLKGKLLRVDLRTPGLRFIGTGRDRDWGKPMPDHQPKSGQPNTIRTRRISTPAFMKECMRPKSEGGRGLDMVAAFNTCPWLPWEAPFNHKYAEPLGVNISQGVVISDNDRVSAHFVIWRDGTVELRDVIPKDDYKRVWLSIGGFGLTLKNGQPTPACADKSRAPRTALALSANANYLYVLTIDGRQPGWSDGATYDELNVILTEAGASDVINLDGGGSTTLCIRDPKTGKPTVVSHATSQGAYCRPVAMNLGIYFAK